MENEPEIDLNRFRKHQRRIPWVLIRKIVIVSVIIGLLYFFKDLLKQKSTNQENQNGIEVEVEL